MRKLVAILLTILMLFSFFQGALKGNDVKADIVDQWIKINNGLKKFSVRSLAVDSASTQAIYAGMNSQSSYEEFLPVLPNASIITQDLGNPLGIYICDKEGKLYYSPDALKTFKFVGTIPIVPYSLVVDPFNNSILYAVDTPNLQNLYISTDSGKSWSLRFRFSFPTCGKILANYKKEGQILILGTDDKGYLLTYLSDDRGQTFKTIYSNDQTQLYGINNVVLSTSGESTRIILLSAKGVFISDNFGETWKNTYSRNAMCVTNTLVVDPTNPSVIYFNDCCKLFRSADRGESWNEIVVPFYTCGISSLAINPIQPSNIVAIDGSNDIYFSMDYGKSWQLAKDNARRDDLASLNSDTIISLPSGNIFVVCDPGFAESYISYDGGQNWTIWQPPSKVKVNYLNLTSIAIDPNNPNHIIAGFDNGIAWTFDGGKTWDSKAVSWCTTKVAFAPSNPKYVYASSSGGESSISFSQDGGVTWKVIKTHIPNRIPNTFYHLFNDIAVDPRDENTIYCSEWLSGVSVSHNPVDCSSYKMTLSSKTYCVEATQNAVYAGTLNGIFVSHDKGETWDTIGPSNLRVESISVSPVNNNIVFAGTTTGIYLSINGGMDWESRNKGLKEVWIHRVKADPINQDIVYAVSYSGYLYISYDKGSTWNIIDKLSKFSDYIAVSSLGSTQRSLFVGGRKYIVSNQNEKVMILRIGQTTFTVNGISNTLDSPPVIKNNRTLLPIRPVVEALGGSVSWDGNERKVIISLGSTTIELWIGKNTARVNGITKPIDSSNSKVVPEIINGRTMLPLRFVTENLGCQLQWDPDTKTITITDQGV